MINDGTKCALQSFERLLGAEELACKKVRAYAATLTDLSVAAQLRGLAERHAARLAALLELYQGEDA